MAGKTYGFRLQYILPTGPFWDRLLTSLLFFRRMGYWPNARNPRSLNEFTLSQKLLFEGDLDLARRLTDKFTVKAWLAENGYGDTVIPTHAAFRSIEEAAAYVIPADVVAKSTHGSGDVMVLKGRAGTKFSEAELAEMREWLREDFYLRCREPNYKGVPPGIIVEEMLKAADGEVPADCKIYFANGHPYMIQMDLDRYTGHVQQLFTPDWEMLPTSRVYDPSVPPVAPPEGLAPAIERFAPMAALFKFARVDLYLLGSAGTYFGEITFFPHNATATFSPPEGDRLIGDLIKEALARPSLRRPPGPNGSLPA